MFLVIDRDKLQMVAAGKNQNHACLIAELDEEIKSFALVSTLDGKSWAMFSEAEMKKLYENTSGEKAPTYGECVQQLREYGNTWTADPRSEKELEKLAHLLEVEDEDKWAAKVREQENRQKIIEFAAKQAGNSGPAQRIEPDAREKAPKAAREPSAAPSKPGATRRVWEIADEVLATGITDLKAVRVAAKDRAVAEGINEGTFGVQFGKWKNSKG